MSKLESFLEIPFGASIEEAKQIIKMRSGSEFDEENSNLETLFFNGIRFGGRETIFTMLSFYEDKFSKASVYIKANLEAYTVSLYEEIKDEINSKYFVSTEDYETYKSPYEKNDGYTETAISIGKANFSCYWNFQNSNAMDDYVSVSINENMNIIISYENGFLIDLLVKERKANDISDY